MIFIEAMQKLLDGEKVRVNHWKDNDYIYLDCYTLLDDTDNKFDYLWDHQEDEWEVYHEPVRIELDDNIYLKVGKEKYLLGPINQFERIKSELAKSLNLHSECVLYGEQVARPAKSTHDVKTSTVFDPLEKPEKDTAFHGFLDEQGVRKSFYTGNTYKFLYREKDSIVPTYSKREAIVRSVEKKNGAVYKIHCELTRNDDKYYKQQSKERVFMPFKIKDWYRV